MKKVKVFFQLKLLPFILFIISKIIFLTAKKRFFYPKEIITPSIIASWHGELFFQPYNYRNFKKDTNMKAIISEHRDGQSIASFLNFFGIGYIKGSSTRGGIKALKEAFKTIDKGIDISITPDGPKGPRHSIANGIVSISQKKNIPIYAFNIVAYNYWQFNSWDKFFIPKPFSRIDFYVSEPFYLNNLSLDEAKEIISKKLKTNYME